MTDGPLTPDLATRFPVELTSYIGRQQPIQDLLKRLEGVRLLTLTGPGGVGKTRLALRLLAARRLRDPSPVAVVELRATMTEQQIVVAIAGALDVQLGRSALAHDLAVQLAGRSVLLVLDGCEPVLDEAASVATALLEQATGFRILATSRTPLHIAGENCWRLQPLDVPDENARTDEIADSEAVRLLVDRVRRLQPDFTLSAGNAQRIAALCRELDGLPLGLELASERVSVLGLYSETSALPHTPGLATRAWPGRPARHLSMEASVAWSWRLLGLDGQLLLGRLAVFDGGWTLPAAEAVCAATRLPSERVFEILERLVQHSVVEVDHASDAVRYRLLASVRAYALRQLAASGELEELLERHLHWYAQLAESLDRAPERTTFDQFERESANLYAALGSANPLTDTTSALRLFAAAWAWWLFREPGEGRRWLARLWGVERPPVSPQLRARLGWLEGAFALQDGDDALSVRELEACVGLADTCGDQLVRSSGRYYLAEAYLAQGATTQAIALLSTALTIGKERSGRLAPGVQARLGMAYLAANDPDSAREHVQQALADARVSGNPWNLTRAWDSAGLLALWDADAQGAAEAFQHAVQSARLMLDPGSWIAPSLSLAELHLSQHATRDAARLLLEVLDRAADDRRPFSRTLLPRLLSAVAAVIAEGRPEQAAGLRAIADAVRAGTTDHRVSNTLLAEARLAVEGVGRRIASTPGVSQLSARELEVAHLLAGDFTNRAIAERLSLSEGTVRVHVGHILHKLGLHSRVQVGQWLPSPCPRLDTQSTDTYTSAHRPTADVDCGY